MGDEPRFPPPRGEEPIGYRDAVAPVSEEKPELPIPSRPPLPRGKRVVASRPDDFDVALAKAYTPPSRTKPQKASFVGVAILIIVIVIYVGLEMASQVRKPSRNLPRVTTSQR